MKNARQLQINYLKLSDHDKENYNRAERLVIEQVKKEHEYAGLMFHYKRIIANISNANKVTGVKPPALLSNHGIVVSDTPKSYDRKFQSGTELSPLSHSLDINHTQLDEGGEEVMFNRT